MSRIWLIRHGEAHVNRVPESGLMPLVDEEGLTEEGVAQAELLRERVARTNEIRPDVVVSSTFPRALQTAQIVNQAWSMPIVESDDIQEWRLGSDALGLTIETALQTWARVQKGEGHDERLSPMTETHNEFISRVDQSLTKLADENNDRNIAVFTHGGVIARSLVTFLGLTPEASISGTHANHTSITEWQRQPESVNTPWRLVRYNDFAHLNG